MGIYFNDTSDIVFEDTSDIKWKRSIPIVLTISASVIGKECLAIGEMLDFGGKESSQQGFCYIEGTVVDPTIDDHIIFDEGNFDIGIFEKTISGILPSTYTIRAYCINTEGVGYGKSITFVIIPDEQVLIRDIVQAAKRIKSGIIDKKIKSVFEVKELTQVVAAVKIKECVVTKKVRVVTCTPSNKQRRDDMLEFSPKQNREEYFLSFNFARVISPLTTISEATITIVNEEGTDVTDTLTDISRQNIVGSKVNFWIRGGNEQTYKITCVITMDNGEVFEQDATIEVIEV